MKRFAARAAVLLLGLGTVTACGTTTSTNGSNDTSNVNSSQTSQVSSQSGQQISIGLTAYPITLDPVHSSAWFDRQVMFNVYDTLFQLGPHNVIEPDLVKSYQISKDGKTYTFHLQTGVQFQDGTPFNAAAVKFNLERGLGKTSTSRSSLDDIVSIDTPNENTVVLHLKAPYSPLLSVLTDRPGMIVSPTAVQKEGSNYPNHPVGTGPYEFENAVKGDHITLVKNPHYWQAGLPKTPTIVFRAFSDPNVELTNLENGAVQIVDTIPPSQVANLQKNPQFTVIDKPSFGFAGYELNLKSGVFQNKDLRQAVDRAINRSALVAVATSGTALPAYSPFGPSSPVYDKQEDTPPPQNAAEIAQLLAKGGQPNGFSFTLKTLPSDKTNAETIQGMLAQYHINMKIEQIDAAGLGTAQQNGNFDMILAGWSGRLDPDQNTIQYFSTGAPLNFGSYSNPQVDALLNKAREQQSMANRKQTYAQVMNILHQDVPFIFLYHSTNLMAYSTKLQGFQYRSDGMIRAATLTLGN